MESNCIFCRIVRGEIPAVKVYEDERTLAFLDITPVNEGHVLLIPKEHYENIFDIPPDVICELAPHIGRLARAVREATGADGINIGMNNGRAAGQIVPHAHIHIMPRHADDGYELWHSTKKYTDGEAEKMAAEIRSVLS